MNNYMKVILSAVKTYIDKVAAKINNSIPTKVSQLENDSNYLKSENVPDWAKEETKPSYTVNEIEGAVTKKYVDGKETIVQPFPVIRIQELIPGKFKAAIINVLDLEKGKSYCLSQDDFNKISDVDNFVVQLVVVCEDGTEKTIISGNTYNIFVTPMGIMSSGDFMFYMDRSFNKSYSIDMSDLTTASNVKYTVFDNGRYLGINNTEEFTPTSNYQPSTKKYVDDSVSSISTANSTVYETKEDATAKLGEAKFYADQVKSDILGGAPKETLDTIAELATAFEENAEVVEAINQAITNKADAEHVHGWDEIENKPFSPAKEYVCENLNGDYDFYEYDYDSELGASRWTHNLSDNEYQSLLLNVGKPLYYKITHNDTLYEGTVSEYKLDENNNLVATEWLVQDSNIGLKVENDTLYYYIGGYEWAEVDFTLYFMSDDKEWINEEALPNTIARVKDVPTHLHMLESDAYNRTVTDEEKEVWNNKSEFSGNWNDLEDKPFYEKSGNGAVFKYSAETGEGTLVGDKTYSYDDFLPFANGSYGGVSVNGEGGYYFRVIKDSSENITIYLENVMSDNIGELCTLAAGESMNTIAVGERMASRFFDFNDGDEITLLISEINKDMTSENIQQLDEKYIPDTIARISDVDEKVSQLEETVNDLLDNGTGTTDAVQYVEQTLTEEQQMQARKNLGLYYTSETYEYIIPEQEVTFDNNGRVTVEYNKLDIKEGSGYFSIGENVYVEGIENLPQYDVYAWNNIYYSFDSGKLQAKDGAPYGAGDTVTIKMYTSVVGNDKIPEEFIPDTIARKEDIPTVEDILNELPTWTGGSY